MDEGADRQAENGTHANGFEDVRRLSRAERLIDELINDILCQGFGDTIAAFELRFTPIDLRHQHSTQRLGHITSLAQEMLNAPLGGMQCFSRWLF